MLPLGEKQNLFNQPDHVHLRQRAPRYVVHTFGRNTACLRKQECPHLLITLFFLNRFGFYLSTNDPRKTTDIRNVAKYVARIIAHVL